MTQLFGALFAGMALLLVACTNEGSNGAALVPTVDRGACTIANGCIEPEGGAVVLAAGDIASCDQDGDETTAALLDDLPGTVLALGDLAYGNGSAEDFAECYDPSWGRHYERTRPVPGNHDYQTAGAEPYFAYFGDAAGEPGDGWYSFDAGTWHVVALNANCGDVECDEGSRQDEWLRADLEENATGCTLVMMHYPRFSSGSQNGSDESMAPFWQVFENAGVEIVLSGHEHNYERFAPQTASGEAADEGIVQFVVGTGGRNLYGFDDAEDNSVVRESDAFGVLKLTLHDGWYEFEFVAEPGADFTDSGSGECH